MLPVDIFVNDLKVIATGRFITSRGSDTVIHLDPEDKNDEMFKVIFRFREISEDKPTVKILPLVEGAPHGLIFDLINFHSQTSAGVSEPFAIAETANAQLFLAFVVHSSPGDNSGGKLFDYTFYSKEFKDGAKKISKK